MFPRPRCLIYGRIIRRTERNVNRFSRGMKKFFADFFAVFRRGTKTVLSLPYDPAAKLMSCRLQKSGLRLDVFIDVFI